MANYSDYGIDIPNGKTAGQVRALCPKCSHERKNKRDKCLSINLDTSVWNCKNCDFKGHLPQERTKVYQKPPTEWKNKTGIGTRVVQYFEKRRISQGTLEKMKITDGDEFMPQENKSVGTIQFNYYKGEELVNVKYRSAKKSFKLYKDAELILYNLNGIKDFDTIYICEGEIDALTIIEAGFDNVVSVPNGGNPHTNKFDYIDNCMDYLFDKKKFIICTDNDPIGRKLKYDLANRLGIENCVYVEFEGAKDANEYLVKEDLNKLKKALLDYKEFPLEGAFTIADIEKEIQDMYQYGLPMGADLNIPQFKLNIVEGYITTVVGIPSHGKSDWVDYMALNLLRFSEWKGAFYSPENKPTELHFSKMARKLIGKNWYGEEKITPAEIEMCMGYLNESFWFIKPEKDFTFDSILATVKQLKLKHGIKFFVIDAWNKLEHKRDKGQSETEYVGTSLDKLAMFCELENMHCFLVVHPTKMRKIKDSDEYEVPTLYDCAGSANFYNKSDNGISIYRDFKENKTYAYIQKIKFSHWGEIGVTDFRYDIASGRYCKNEFDKEVAWIRTLPQKSMAEIALEKTPWDND